MKSLTHVYCHTCICSLRQYFLLFFFFKIYPVSDLFCQLHYCHFGPWTFSRWKPLTGILPFTAPNYPPCSRATEQLEWCFHNINQTKVTFRTLNDSSFNQIRPKSLQWPTRLCAICPLTPNPQLHCQVHLISFFRLFTLPQPHWPCFPNTASALPLNTWLYLLCLEHVFLRYLHDSYP